MTTPRVVFVTDAGGEAGLGHFKRCAALARALVRHDLGVELLVAGPPDGRLAALAPGLAATPLDWWGAPGHVLDATAVGGVEAFVVDSYHADASLLAALRRKALVVAIDDLADRPLPVDVVVNGAWHAERLAYDVPAETRRLLGPRYALLDSAYADVGSRAVGARVDRVLVTLGGATPTAETAGAIAAVRAALPGVAVDVAGGLVAVEAPAGVTLHGPLPSLRALLVAADLAVTASGMTLYECLATATPTVALCVAENQRPNFEHLGAAGLVVASASAALTSTIARVAADRALRARLAADGRRAVDGRGAERVAATIAETLAARALPRSG